MKTVTDGLIRIGSVDLNVDYVNVLYVHLAQVVAKSVVKIPVNLVDLSVKSMNRQFLMVLSVYYVKVGLPR